MKTTLAHWRRAAVGATPGREISRRGRRRSPPRALASPRRLRSSPSCLRIGRSPPAGRRAAKRRWPRSTRGSISRSRTGGSCASPASTFPTPAAASRRPRKGRTTFLPAGSSAARRRFSRFAPAPDRWGRVLADLATPDAADPSAALALLAAGWARVRPQFETRGCAEAPTRSWKLRRARRAWDCGAIPPMRCSTPTTPDALGALGGRFVVVEGKVRRVGIGRCAPLS